jgi:hypothetical protein
VLRTSFENMSNMKRMKLLFSTPRRQSKQTHIIVTMPCVKES